METGSNLSRCLFCDGAARYMVKESQRLCSSCFFLNQSWSDPTHRMLLPSELRPQKDFTADTVPVIGIGRFSKKNGANI
jgi:hypothetical protein